MPRTVSRLPELVAIAALYVISARIGQIFAIPPGNITPIWIPSGLMMALVILRGYSIWPAIFVGALAGNVWAYFDLARLGAVIAAGTANAIADVLATVGAVVLLKKTAGSINPFKDQHVFWRFLLYGALLGPAVSAAISVTALSVCDFVSWRDYPTAALTWWMGDGIGVLLISPAILVFHFHPDGMALRGSGKEFASFMLCAVTITALCFVPVDEGSLLPSPAFLMVPMLIWALVRLGLHTTFISVLAFAVVCVVATSYGVGPFARETQWLSLITMHSYFALIATSVFVLGSIILEKQRLMSQLKMQAIKDPLTGAYNRNHFDTALGQEIQRFTRTRTPFSLIMLDIDNFKEVNDNYGHATGDHVLKEIVSLLQKELRATDVLARWGGEEFLLLLPGSPIDGAFQFAERCRQRIADTDILKTRPVTVSLGVIEYEPGMEKSLLLRLLDDALYQSKGQGRNVSTRAALPSKPAAAAMPET